MSDLLQKVIKPWGTYETIKESDNYNAKYKQRYAGDFKKGSLLSRILKKIKCTILNI